MEKKPNGRIKVTENLVILERGEEELLLGNSFDLQPLYIKKGRGHIKRILESVQGLGTLKKIEEAFPEDVPLLNLLRDHRILVDAESETGGHAEPDMSFLKASKKDRSGMSLYLLLTQSCNLECIYCLNGIKTYKAENNLKMTEEIAYTSVEKCLKSLNSNGRLEIAFFGGEPLLNWPLAKKVITYCEETLKEKHRDKEILYHITSNLTFLPSDLIEWAKRYNITFLCDVDGPEKIHDQCRPYKDGKPSHTAITANIRRLIDAGLKVSLRATVTSINQHHMMETASHHKDLGGRGSAFVPVNPVTSDEDLLLDDLLPAPEVLIKGLVEIYKSKIWESTHLFPFSVYSSKIQPGSKIVMGCGAPYGNTPVVDVHGDVYPCIYLVGIKRFFLGNVLDDDYPNEKVLDWMMDLLHVDNLEDCRRCPWRYLCGGGCPVGRLIILDNPGVTPKVETYCGKISCEYTKKILELLFWELATEASLSIENVTPQEASVAIDHSNTIHC
ncbi:MAG: SPASM domain-containing protein [Desulfobacterales bacterium]|nr:SPASM domain-containing protein [Desulfobacterales bacterium]